MRAVTSIQVSPLFFSVVLSNFGNLYQLRYRLNYLPMALNLIWKGGASLTGKGVQTIWGVHTYHYSIYRGVLGFNHTIDDIVAEIIVFDIDILYTSIRGLQF